ncbi:uncharacterized protein AB9X84_002299 isoform 2-T2 [Acanthopagrus schlegelii]
MRLFHLHPYKETGNSRLLRRDVHITSRSHSAHFVVCDNSFFFGSDQQAAERMKAVMIFLVLTLVVVMAEAQSYGPISGSGNAETTGGLHFGGRRRATSQVEVAEDRLRRYYED